MHIPRHFFVFLLVGYAAALSAAMGQHLTGSAVDVNGKRHLPTPGSRVNPWISDIVSFPRPEYPYADRAKWNQGEGIFRLTLDTKTGSVTKVAVIKSTGFGSLDSAALTALRKARWKPGKWKEVDMPVNFTMARQR
jgi:TonB family protein